MRIQHCDASHEASWNAFVSRCPHASFYHRWEWRAINERAFGHKTAYLAAVEDDGRFVGVFPLVQLKSLLFGNVGCSMPFVNYGGPAAETPEAERRLLEAASGVADDWGLDYLEIRSQRRLGEHLPASDHKVSMTITLDPDSEVVLGRLSREQRHEIRRACKRGFVVRFGPELLGDFYAILSESWRDLGTPIYRLDYLASVLAAFPHETRVCVVYDAHGRPAAGSIDGMQGPVVEGMWLGIRAEYRKQLVGYVLYWELIKNACERGFSRYHLGRSSKDSGGEQFKKKWNAEALQLYWHYVLRTRRDMPGLNPANPKFQLAIRTWRRLPLPVTQFLGPYIARSIP